MSDGTTIEPGDWIRFYQNNRMVIARVEYIHIVLGGFTEYCTDYGTTREVLEVRKP